MAGCAPAHRWMLKTEADSIRSPDCSLSRISPAASASSDGKVKLWDSEPYEGLLYSPGMSAPDVHALGRILTREGYLGGTAGIRAMLSRSAGRVMLSFALPDGAWEQPAIVAALRKVGKTLADDPFGSTLLVRLCNRHFTGEFAHFDNLIAGNDFVDFRVFRFCRPAENLDQRFIFR